MQQHSLDISFFIGILVFHTSVRYYPSTSRLFTENTTLNHFILPKNTQHKVRFYFDPLHGDSEKLVCDHKNKIQIN